VEQRFIRAGRWIGFLALAGIAIWLVLAALAPVERTQGIIQKIFYAHVPCVPPAYLGFILTAIGGIGYLRTRKQTWDRLAVAGAEVGIVFCTLMLLTGPLWAKPVWGHWWVWDLRLVLTLVLWFIYLAYLFLRAFAFGSDAARTFASVYGIVGTAVIPFVYYAVDIAGGRTVHPENPARQGLPAEMWTPLVAGMAALLLVFLYLLSRRIEVARLESRLFDAMASEAS
jgi:heme exporter protein C